MRTKKLFAGLVCIIFGIWLTSWRGHTPRLEQFKQAADEINTEQYQQLVRDNL